MADKFDVKVRSTPLDIFILGRGLIFFGLAIGLIFAPAEHHSLYAWLLLLAFLVHLSLFNLFSKKKIVKKDTLFSVTFIFDLFFITGLIYFTGGTDSDFYLLYYLCISAGAYYWGLSGGLFLAFFASSLYLFLNGMDFQNISPGDLIIRVSFFWAFALVVGVVSRFIKQSEIKLIQTLDTLNERTVELEKSQVQIESIYEAARTLGEIYKLEEVIDEVLRIAHDVLGYQVCSVLLMDYNKNCLLLWAKMEMEEKFKYDPPPEIPVNGIVGSVVKKGKGKRIFDVTYDPRYIPRTEGAKSEMVVPMISRGKVVGVLECESKKAGAFSEQDQKIFSILASSAAMAIENAILHKKTEELTVVDELTGVFNYRYFTKKITDELKRAKRYHQPLSLIMIDIDWFKKCNDTYGHLFGNLVLKNLAQVIRGCIREVDILVRYGGEEFVVILPQTSKEDALSIGERIRSSVESTIFADETDQVKTLLTVSLGVACYPEDAYEKEGFLMKVDQALYLAKGKGKNLVCTV
jgi:diguanylate cyclase (GGDEF)-like protein